MAFLDKIMGLGIDYKSSAFREKDASMP